MRALGTLPQTPTHPDPRPQPTQTPTPNPARSPHPTKPTTSRRRVQGGSRSRYKRLACDLFAFDHILPSWEHAVLGLCFATSLWLRQSCSRASGLMRQMTEVGPNTRVKRPGPIARAKYQTRLAELERPRAIAELDAEPTSASMEVPNKCEPPIAHKFILSGGSCLRPPLQIKCISVTVS